MIQAYPLAWPDGWKRTPPAQRTGARFNKKEQRYVPGGDPGTGYYRRDTKEISVYDGVARILESLERMGVTRGNVIISTNIPTRQDGTPRSDRKAPDDPGVAVYWRKNNKGTPRTIAIDQYDSVAGNLGAIAATLEAMRAIHRHGGAEILERTFTGFLALPEKASQPWRGVLGFSTVETISREEIESRYRELVKQHHPDAGGDRDRFEAIVQAKRDALAEAA